VTQRVLSVNCDNCMAVILPLICAGLLALAAGDTGGGDCCERVATLEQRYEASLAAMEQRHEARLAALEKQYLARLEAFDRQSKVSGTRSVHTVSPDGSMRAGPHPRQLSNGDTHLALPSVQVHEFPAGHSCSNLDSGTTSDLRMMLPHTGSAVSFKPSPDWTATTTNEMSLASIGKDWTANEIQRIPAPLKVVHDASCSNAPKLEVQLEATVPSLTATSSISGRTRLHETGDTLVNFGHQLAFLMMVNSGRKLSIRNPSQSKFLACNGGLSTADSAGGDWEKVRITTGKGGLTIQCHTDNYNHILQFSDQSAFSTTNTNSFGDWERFAIYIPDSGGATSTYPGSVVIYHSRYSKFLGMDGGNVVTADSVVDDKYAWYLDYND